MFVSLRGCVCDCLCARCVVVFVFVCVCSLACLVVDRTKLVTSALRVIGQCHEVLKHAQIVGLDLVKLVSTAITHPPKLMRKRSS